MEETKEKYFGFNLEASLYERLDEEAIRQDRSMGYIVRQALIEYLNKKKE